MSSCSPASGRARELCSPNCGLVSSAAACACASIGAIRSTRSRPYAPRCSCTGGSRPERSSGWRARWRHPRPPTAVINPPDACLLALNRARALEALRAAGVPVPSSSVHDDWEDVRRRIRDGDVYVKAPSGSTGRGAGVASLSRDAAGAADPPFPGPWHVEAALPGDGQDRKLYVVGPRVFGLLKAWPRDGSPARAFEPPPAMTELALAAGRAVGLELFGVDLVGRGGALAVVDLNPFPGYRGVEGAVAAVADHVAARAAAG